MRSLPHIECFNVGCTNKASVTINGDHVCTQCASADLPNEMHKLLSAQDNQVCNCGQPAADDIRYSGMCTDCFQQDCEAAMADADVMNDNLRKHGTIDKPTQE